MRILGDENIRTIFSLLTGRSIENKIHIFGPVGAGMGSHNRRDHFDIRSVNIHSIDFIAFIAVPF